MAVYEKYYMYLIFGYQKMIFWYKKMICIFWTLEKKFGPVNLV